MEISVVLRSSKITIPHKVLWKVKAMGIRGKSELQGEMSSLYTRDGQTTALGPIPALRKFFQMGAKRIIPFVLIIRFSLAVLPTVQFIDSKIHEKSPLCDLGCKCPEQEQNFVIMDCSQRGISKLPTSLEFGHPISVINFQSNRIKSLEMSTFARVDNIEELDLSANQITQIQNFTFAPLPLAGAAQTLAQLLDGGGPGSPGRHAQPESAGDRAQRHSATEQHGFPSHP
ncbi:hypothetical protein CDAR_553461 [Caerostris darwini]|uniref:Uncharacterized protein n=1 Tax=Caerostris darwini TaxID=1538125 RepID=A0AAV4T9E4_9ARAC|nr:hypothetical protein CDAR_553461 [Caerostris darwini]